MVKAMILLFLLAGTLFQPAHAQTAPATQATNVLTEEYKNVRITLHTDKSVVWARQQFRVWVEIETADRYASVLADEFKSEGFYSARIDPSRIQPADKNGPTLLKVGWLLYPNEAGEHRITLPDITYQLGGKHQWQYRLPPVDLSVRSLPPYVLPTMPVGKIILASDIDGRYLLRKNTLSYWNITVSSASAMPTSLTPVLRQLESHADFVFLPAEARRETNPTVNGINARVIYNIPFKPVANGMLGLPALRAHYFDPGTGKVETTVLVNEPVLSLGTYLYVLLGAIALYVMFIFTMMTYRAATRYRQGRRSRKKAVTAIRSSNNPDELRGALRNYAKARGWKYNLPVSRWLACWPTGQSSGKDLEKLLETLSAASFARETPGMDIHTLKEKLLRQLDG